MISELRSYKILASAKPDPAVRYNSSFSTLRLGGSRLIPGFPLPSGLRLRPVFFLRFKPIPKSFNAAVRVYNIRMEFFSLQKSAD